MIFPNESTAMVEAALNGIREEIGTRALRRRSTNDELGAVTISAGLAQRHPGETGSSLLDRADERPLRLQAQRPQPGHQRRARRRSGLQTAAACGADRSVAGLLVCLHAQLRLCRRLLAPVDRLRPDGGLCGPGPRAETPPPGSSVAM